MVREMTETLRFLYTQGGDFTKLQSEFFDPAVQLIKNEKTSGLQKLIFVQLSGKLFKSVWTRCPNPPTKDLYEALTKLKPNLSEKFLRESAYKALKDIIKCNPSNLFQIQPDLLKHLIRASKDEKMPSVKAEILGCLRALIRDTMNYSTLHTNYDTIFQSVLKGFEEPEVEVQHGWVAICIALIGTRLQESQQQGDIRTGHKAFNQQQRDALVAAKKKPNATLLDVPRTLSDAISLLSALMIQPGILLIVRQQLAQSLIGLMELYPTHLEATDVETILNTLLLTISTKKDAEGFQQRELVIWLLTNAVQLMQLDQMTALLKLAIQSLERKQLLISVGTLQTLQACCSKSQPLSTLINEHHIISLLRVASSIIFKMDQNTFSSVFSQEKDILNATSSYFRSPNSQEIRLFAGELVKAIGFRAPKWIHNLISMYLSMTSIQNADNQSLAQTSIYGSAIPEKAQLRAELIENNSTLRMLATALACLISSVRETIKGVPLALVTTALNAAKNQILGNVPLDLSVDQSSRLDLNQIEIHSSQRQESGWIILQGLLTLGSDWIDTQSSLITKLFRTVFCKTMCQIELKRIKDQTYQELLLRELKIKQQALACVKIFLDQASEELRQKTNALIGSYLCNAVEFLLHLTEDKRNVEKLFAHYLPKDLEKAKQDLIYCIGRIPPEFTKTSHAFLAQSLSEMILQSKAGDYAIQNLVNKMLSRQDSHIREPKQTKTIQKSLWQKSPEHLQVSLKCNQTDQLDQIQDTILSHNSPFKGQKQVSKQVTSGMDSNISLFANIFLSESLDQRSRLQLLSQFYMMIEKDTKDKPERLFRVGTTLIYLVKLSNQVTIKTEPIATFSLRHATQLPQPLTVEESSKIFKILNLMFKVDDELLIRLAGETYVHLLAPKIISQPAGILNQVLADLEAEVQTKIPDENPEGKLIKKRAAVICAMLVRLFDAEHVLGDIKNRITALMFRLLKETDHSIRRFTVHYACEIGIEGLFENEQDQQNYFNYVFPSIFHLVQTDIQPNYTDFAALAKLINAQLRFFEPDCTRNPPSPLRVFLSGNKRMQTVIHEMIEIFFLPKNSYVATLQQAIEMVKTAIIAGLDIVESRKQQILTRCIELIRNRNLNLKIKQQLVETLGAAVVKGYFEGNAKLAQGFQNILIDELNQATIENTQLISQKTKLDIDEVFSSCDQFEQLINYEGTNTLEELEQETKPISTAQLYMGSLKVLLLLVFKQNPAGKEDFPSSFNNLMNLTKSLIMYKHSTLSQQQELGLKIDQGRAIIDQPNSFFYAQNLSQDVVHFVAKAFKSQVTLFATVQAGNGESDLFGESKDSDVRGQISNLITLAFTIISQDSTKLKKVGLKLVIEIVKLFSQACEKVGDDDDDEKSKQMTEKRKIKTFLASPLLLEQYEAQIFSIIRTHLQKQAAGKSIIPPDITAINYDLIYLFVTSPICKDQSSIKKILDMLMENMEKTQLVGVEMHSFEGAITDAHFKKLVLLAKLLIICQPKGETQIERLGQAIDDVDISYQSGSTRVLAAHKSDQILPSKFTKEDQERLADLFKPQILKMLSKHFNCALNDALIAQLGRQGNSRKFEFITSVGSQGSAYSAKIVAQTVPYAICALSQIAGMDKTFTMSKTEALAIRASLLHGLSFQPILLGMRHNQNIQRSDIVRFTNQKLCYLSFVEEILGQAPQLVAQGRAELTELLTILEKFPSLGIVEIDVAVLKIISRALPHLIKYDLLEKAFEITAQIFGSLNPQLYDQNSLDRDQNEFGGFLSSSNAKATDPTDILEADKKLPLLQLCSQVLVAIATDSIQNKCVYLLMLLKTIVPSIALNIDQITDTQTQEHLIILSTDILRLVQQTSDQALKLLQTQLTSLGCKIVMQAVAQNQFSTSSQVIFTSIVSAIQEDDSQLRSALQVLAQSDAQANVVLQVVRACSFSTTESLKFQAGTQLFQLSHRQILQTPNDDFISNCLSEIARFYAAGLDTAQRTALLPVYFGLLFSVIQMKQLLPQTRQIGAEGIFSIFRVDQQAFKNYAAPIPGTNQSNLTPPEKTLIENIIKQFAALSMQSQNTVASQPAIGNIRQPVQTQASQESLAQKTAAVQASKIKLGFNFKANK